MRSHHLRLVFLPVTLCLAYTMSLHCVTTGSMVVSTLLTPPVLDHHKQVDWEACSSVVSVLPLATPSFFFFAFCKIVCTFVNTTMLMSDRMNEERSVGVVCLPLLCLTLFPHSAFVKTKFLCYGCRLLQFAIHMFLVGMPPCSNLSFKLLTSHGALNLTRQRHCGKPHGQTVVSCIKASREHVCLECKWVCQTAQTHESLLHILARLDGSFVMVVDRTVYRQQQA